MPYINSFIRNYLRFSIDPADNSSGLFQSPGWEKSGSVLALKTININSVKSQ
jgi:hypothetical protein